MSRPLRILIVDDEFLIADYIASVVEEAGHTVVGTAASADEAMRLLIEEKPDVAILDIKIDGDRDGIELATEMQAAGLEVPHVFITGSGDPRTKTRAEATGPIAFLQKPLNAPQLEVALRAVRLER